MTDQATPATPDSGYLAPEPPKKKSNFFSSLLFRIGLLVVVVIGVFVYKYATGDPETTAEVGKCLANASEANADDANVVDCGDAKAVYKIVGKYDGVTGTEADTKCQAESAVTDEYYVYGPKSGSGMHLCLVKK